MKSDKFLHYLGKYYALALSLVAVTVALDTLQTRDSQLALASACLFILAAIFLLISFFYTYSKFAVVELTTKGVCLIADSKTSIIPWEKVQSIRRHSNLLRSPFYKVKVAHSKNFVIFGTPLKFWDIDDQNISVQDINKYIATKRGKTEFEEEC